MPNIFTRAEITKLMANDALTPEQRTEQVMSLYGRALDDGYISKSAARTAQETAIANARTEWEKGQEKPNIKESEEYKQLQGQFDSYKQMQNARTSEDFKDVKPKFFETVYGMIDRSEGAKPVKEQLEAVHKQYEEYFTPQTPGGKPNFGSPDQGGMPKGNEGAEASFTSHWGFVPKKS